MPSQIVQRPSQAQFVQRGLDGATFVFNGENTAQARADRLAAEAARDEAEAAAASLVIPYGANIIPADGDLTAGHLVPLIDNTKGSRTFGDIYARVTHGTGTADLSILKNGILVYGPVEISTTALEADPGFSVVADDTVEYLIENGSGTIDRIYSEIF